MEEPVGPPSGIHGHDLTLGYWFIRRRRRHGAFMCAREERSPPAFNMPSAAKVDFEYRFANDLTWSGGPGYLVALNDDFTFSIQAVVSGEYKGKDTFQGEKAEDTGVTAVYLGPQLILTWKEILARKSGPICRSVYKTHRSRPCRDYRIRAILTWHF